MKTLGLIGGTSWVSTLDYYKIINQEVNKELGDNNSGKIILYSINFNDLVENQKKKDFGAIENILADAGMSLRNAGVDKLMLCANTIHRYARAVSDRSGLDFVHIAHETAKVIKSKKVKKAGLLGTLPTMTESFYKDVLSSNGIDSLIPGEDDMKFIHRVIFKELSREIFKKETKERLLDICSDLVSRGSGGIILGCTELPLIIKQDDLKVPAFDTLRIHAEAGARYLISSTE